MIKIKSRKVLDAVECEMELGGDKFPIVLKPITEEYRAEKLMPFRKMKHIRNPVGGKMELVTYWDDLNPEYRKVADDLLNEIIVSFGGVDIEDEKGNPITDERERKLVLGSIEVEDMETIPISDEAGEKASIQVPRTRLFGQLIFGKAISLSKAHMEEETKNS
jgi:hypothetical protein